MRLVEARRFMGPNLVTPCAAALAELALDPGDSEGRLVAAWQGEVNRMLAALGRSPLATASRFSARSAELVIVAPIDQLLPLADLVEWAALSTARILAGDEPSPLEPTRATVESALVAEANPALLDLQREARARGIPFLWDDELVSVGHGQRCRSFPLRAIPSMSDVPWSDLGAIPVGLITGTNGKTTCSRLLARIVREAGMVPGYTSSDGVVIGREMVEEGDWTGPSAARLVLRHPGVEVAVLEIARGGILRRGLAMEADSADGALITNISTDHLGEYGIDDLSAMARAKAIIGSIVKPTGRVVLNAADPALVALAQSFPAPIVYFAHDPGATSAKAADVMSTHRARGGEAWIVSGGNIVHARGGQETTLLPVDDVAIALHGSAPYNVENALGVAALATALGLPMEAIAAGLRSFGRRHEDNPGRGQIFDVGGVRLVTDFAHNREAVRAVLAMVESLRAGRGRLAVISGHSGDRSDEEIQTIARVIHGSAPDLVLLRDIAGYLRGRQPDEVPGVFRSELIRLGQAERSIAIAPDEVSAVRRALDWAVPGDTVALLVHVDPEGVAEVIRQR